MARFQIRVCGGGSMRVGNPDCPNAANHQPHPSGYISCSDWADDALIVADQQECAGCGRLEIWVPKRADLRIAADWPPPVCDWGGCDADGVAERFWPEVQLPVDGELRVGRWLSVCAEHAEVAA